MKRRFVFNLTVVAALAAAGAVYYRATFPYGRSHCCIDLMSFALEEFAREHDGKYPAGEVSPEASLSLLCKSNQVGPHIMRGMTVSESAVRRVLESGQLPGPDTCGWHYVPGLTQADDPSLALLWCKAALGHNGQRTRGGGRQVVFVGGATRWVSGNEWPEFLRQQDELLRTRSARALTGQPLVAAILSFPTERAATRPKGHGRSGKSRKGPIHREAESPPGEVLYAISSSGIRRPCGTPRSPARSQYRT